MTTRKCDGTDHELLRERVSRTSHAGQESVDWVPCDCGEQFDDTQRVLIYPHYFLPNNMGEEARNAMSRRIAELVAGGRSAEEIRQWLTSQPLDANLVEKNKELHQKGKPMGEDESVGRTGSVHEPDGDSDKTDVVSAEGSNQAQVDETAEEAEARRERDRRESQGF